MIMDQARFKLLKVIDFNAFCLNLWTTLLAGRLKKSRKSMRLTFMWIIWVSWSLACIDRKKKEGGEVLELNQ